MPSDLYAQRVRIVSASNGNPVGSAWTVSAYGGTTNDPNGVVSEPTGSLLRTNDGGIWINSDGSTTWLKLGGGAQAFSFAAVGTEGAQATVSLPRAYPNNDYRVFITNAAGTYGSVYQIPSGSRTTTNFLLNSTSPFQSGDRFDFFTISGSFGGFGGNSSGANVSATGTLSISSASIATVTLSTEGNIDWFANIANQNPPRGQAVNGTHSKIGGGWIMETWTWAVAGNSFTFDTAAMTARTTVVTDSIANVALSANTAWSRIFSLSSPTNGWGFQFRVPAESRVRRLKVYFGGYSIAATCTARLTDGSAPNVSCTFSTGASTTNSTIVTVDFSAAIRAELVFTVIVQGRYTTDPNIMFGHATLSGNL